MSAVTPALLRFAAALKAASPAPSHQVAALTARGYAELLTPGECWFLDTVARLPQLSSGQAARLNEIAAKVERGRR